MYLRVVTSHLSFGSSRVIWSHFRVPVESSRVSRVMYKISMGMSPGILLESLVMSWYVNRVWLDYNTDVPPFYMFLALLK